MAESRNRRPRGRNRDRRRQTRALTRGLMTVLAQRDAASAVAVRQADARLICGHCQSRVARKKATLECRGCGRSKPIEVSTV